MIQSDSIIQNVNNEISNSIDAELYAPEYKAILIEKYSLKDIKLSKNKISSEIKNVPIQVVLNFKSDDIYNVDSDRGDLIEISRVVEGDYVIIDNLYNQGKFPKSEVIEYGQDNNGRPQFTFTACSFSFKKFPADVESEKKKMDSAFSEIERVLDKYNSDVLLFNSLKLEPYIENAIQQEKWKRRDDNEIINAFTL
jgi:hypothetical protein